MADTTDRRPAAPPGFNLKRHKKRADAAWQTRALWQKLYDDAYEFAIPYRRPASRLGKAANTVERVFDNTAIVSSFRSAGQLHQDLFPSGQQSFRLAPGPIAEMATGEGEGQKLRKQLDRISRTVSAFLRVPEFDLATSEMCIDLLVGTGSLMPLPGTGQRPVRFVALPFDEVALECDAYGAPTLISWRTKLTRRQMRRAWPEGNFPSEWKNDSQEEHEDSEVPVSQDFYLDDDGAWTFVAYLVDKDDGPVAWERYRTQPVAVPRYYRVPGEPYGRGPVLLALPTVKTLNKAMELMLKAAAIQMLGIWGYRPGGAFNPDSQRIAPGQFWPMSSTGGVLGQDVQRLDLQTGRMDVSQLITSELRLQVQAALHDDKLPDKGATPVSATEIVERMKRTATNYLGAFGRLVNEIHPVVVRRVIEILYDQQLLEVDLDIDQLLVKLDVLSPIAQALRAQALSVITDYIELVAAVRGPQAIDLLVKTDDALRHIGNETGVPPQFIMSRNEQKELEAKVRRAAAAMVAAQGGDASGAGAAVQSLTRAA